MKQYSKQYAAQCLTIGFYLGLELSNYSSRDSFQMPTFSRCLLVKGTFTRFKKEKEKKCFYFLAIHYAQEKSFFFVHHLIIRKI